MEAAPISPPLTFDAFQSLSADAARPLYDAAQTTSAHHVRFVLSTAREHASRVRQGSISQPSAGLVELALRTRENLEPLVQAATELDDLLGELRRGRAGPVASTASSNDGRARDQEGPDRDAVAGCMASRAYDVSESEVDEGDTPSTTSWMRKKPASPKVFDDAATSTPAAAASGFEDRRRMTSRSPLVREISGEAMLLAKLAGETSRSAMPWFMISASSSFRGSWDSLMILIVLYTMLEVPFTLAFITGDQLVDLYATVTVLDYITTVIFILDLFSNFITSIPNGDQEICDLRVIAKRYVGGPWFWVDFVSCIPTAFIDGLDDILDPSVLKFLKLVRLVRMGKMCVSRASYKM